jgi:GNAT superfamily N-acetyltransferase
MKTEAAIRAAAERNFVGSYVKLVEHVAGAELREFGAVTAFMTGVPIGIFNGCIAPSPPHPDELEAALDWVAEAGVPHCLWTPKDLAPELVPVADRRAMAASDWILPHMALTSRSEAPPAAPGVTVRQANDAGSLAEFRRVLVAGGVTAEIAARLFRASLLDDEDVRIVVAALDGRTAGTAMAIRTGDVAGVYAVETTTDARRRGVATAATWAAVATGQAWGCDPIVLQSSRMGYGVYEAMGFRTVARYAIFRAP